MLDFDWFGSGKQKGNGNAAEQQQQVKKAGLVLGNKKAPLSPLSTFNKPCNEAEITKSTKAVPLTTARSTNWARHVSQDWVI